MLTVNGRRVVVEDDVLSRSAGYRLLRKNTELCISSSTNTTDGVLVVNALKDILNVFFDQLKTIQFNRKTVPSNTVYRKHYVRILFYECTRFVRKINFFLYIMRRVEFVL